MPWQLSGVILILANSARAVQYRRLGFYGRDLSAYTLAASYACLQICSLAIAMFSGVDVNHNAAWNAAPHIFIGGLLFGIINFLTVVRYRYITASLGIFLGLLNTVSVIVVAAIFIDESLSVEQWLGALTLLSAVVLVGLAARDKSNAVKEKKIFIGVLIAVITALLIGPAAVNEKYLIDTIGIETYFLYGISMQTFFAFIFAFLLRRRTRTGVKLRRKTHYDVWLAAVLFGYLGVFYLLTLIGSDSASLAFLIQAAVVAVTVFMAYFILHERENLKLKIFGLLLSAAGLYLLFS